MKLGIFIITILYVCILMQATECKSGKTKRFDLQSKETNMVNFFRLVLMRLIFGIAASMGYGERLTEIFNGFAPPDAEDYNDGGDYDYGAEDIF